MDNSVRIDKWLWCVRLYKTRTMASDACTGGKVTIDDVNVKPSRMVKINDVIKVHQPPITKTIKVLNVLENRIGAKLVPEYLEDLTPKEEYEKIEMARLTNMEYREHGIGRPTKKDRRKIDKLKNLYN